MSQQSTEQNPTYFKARGDTVRERLLDALRTDLLGPEAPEEVLGQSPTSRYLIGMLAPRGTQVSSSEDEGSPSTVRDGDEHESGPRVTQQLAPSSIGLSFIVGLHCHSVDIRASWGEYTKVEAADGAEVPAEEAADIDPDEDPNTTATTKHKEFDWIRTPFDVTMRLSLSNRSGHEEVSHGASIEWLVETLGGRQVVSAFLVNTRTAPLDRRPPDEDWIYQPEVSVSGDGPVFESRRSPRTSPDTDPDMASADLVYRQRREFAVGHGVAVGWDTETRDSTRATRVYTTIVPSREVSMVRGPDSVPQLSMDHLGQAESPEQLQSQLAPLLNAYAEWINRQRAEVDNISPPDDIVAREHIAAQEQSLERMRLGLQCLAEPRAFEAFRFANRAMAMQRRTSVRVLRRRRGDAVQPNDQIPADWASIPDWFHSTGPYVTGPSFTPRPRGRRPSLVPRPPEARQKHISDSLRSLSHCGA